jgi:hypothetical protein
MDYTLNDPVNPGNVKIANFNLMKPGFTFNKLALTPGQALDPCSRASPGEFTLMIL